MATVIPEVKKIQEVKDVYNKVKSALELMYIHPALRGIGLTIKSMIDSGHVKVIEKPLKIGGRVLDTAAATDTNIILVKTFVDKLTVADLRFILAHELLHIAFGHVKVYRNYSYPTIMNIATDKEINDFLNRIGITTSLIRKSGVFSSTVKHIVRKMIDNALQSLPPEKKEELREIYDYIDKTLDEKSVSKMDVPQLYGTIISILNRIKSIIKQDINNDKLRESLIGIPGSDDIVSIEEVKKRLEETGEAEKLSEEDLRRLNEIFGNGKETPKNLDEIEKEARKLRDKIRERIRNEMMKHAGTGLSEAARSLIDKLHQPRISWREILYDAISGEASTVIETWHRLSRRIPYRRPGLRYESVVNTIVIVDVSGSIGDNELTDFLSEINGILEETGGVIHLIAFASGIVGELHGDSIDIDKVMKWIKSLPSGGTEIHDALSRAYEYLEEENVVVVFTDGYIFDAKTDSVRQLANGILDLAIPVFVTTAVVPDAFRDWIRVNYYDEKMR